MRKTIKAIFAAMLLSLAGCAHQQLVNDGQDYMAQGRYELAVARYARALQLQPGDRETQASLERARALLAQWLRRVRVAADQAAAQGKPGKAMLLYGKLASLQHAGDALQRYNAIRRELGERYRLKLRLVYDPRDFGRGLGAGIAGLLPVTGRQPRSDDIPVIRLRRDRARIRVDEHQRTQTTRYLAGTRTIANPEFVELQAEINARRQKIHGYRHQRKQLRHEYSEVHEALHASTERLDAAQEKLDASGEGNREHARLETEMEDLKEENRDLLKEQNKLQRKLEKNDLRLRHSGKKLDAALDALSYLPATIEQEVYSDYNYPVRIVTQTASTTIEIEQDGVRRTIPVRVIDEVEAHDAYPVIGLQGAPVRLKPRRRMFGELDEQVRAQTNAALQSVVEAWRRSWLDRAQATADNDQRFEYEVAYALSGNSYIDRDLARRMREQLVLQVGQAGEFDVARLLNLGR